MSSGFPSVSSEQHGAGVGLYDPMGRCSGTWKSRNHTALRWNSAPHKGVAAAREGSPQLS